MVNMLGGGVEEIKFFPKSSKPGKIWKISSFVGTFGSFVADLAILSQKFLIF